MATFPVFFTAAGQTAFTDEVRTSDYIITQTLGAAEPTALEISAEYQQLRANYARPAANTTLTYDNGAGSDVTAYFIDDVDFQDRGGGLQSWTRLWATIPATWSEPGGTFAYTFPGFVSSIAWGSIFPITGIYQYNANFVICNTNGTFSVGVDCYIDVNYVRSNQNYHLTYSTPSIGVSAGTYFGITPNMPGSGTWSGVVGTVRGGQTSRLAPETHEVDTFLLHDYALSDEVNVDIQLPQVDMFNPVDASGNAVTTLTAGTLPTAATYSSMVNAGTMIAVRRSDRRKYMGNIYERTTLLVKAR